MGTSLSWRKGSDGRVGSIANWRVVAGFATERVRAYTSVWIYKTFSFIQSKLDLRNDQTFIHVFYFVRVTRSHRLLKADVSEAEEHLVKELESELARVRADLDSAGQEEHDMNQEDQTTAEELAQSESQAKSLRTQMDQLTQEIKQANLQSLSIAPADDLKILLEGINNS